MKRIDIIKISVLVLLLVAGISIYFGTGLNKLGPGELKNWIESFGVWAGLVFIALYTIGPVFYIPGSILSISAGIIFGSLWGTIYVLIGATLGATAAFLTARFFGEAIKEKISKTKFLKLKEADEKIETSGFWFVVTLRLIPLIPYNALNYLFGFTKVKTRDYIIGSFVGMIPGIFAYVYLGSNILNPLSPSFWIAIAIFLAVIFVPNYVRKKMGLKK